MKIPDGYCLVPLKWLEKQVLKDEWTEITEPKISQVSKHLGIGVDKIKKDLNKIGCPLRKSQPGGKGRGNEIRFFKPTVECYKGWLDRK
ncbi:hypothetical protein ASG01_04815 [Chryseobacterium sp. Leaf180]|uniref:hypothetical protein n=1 Tax=Chryseobacterium sp. Leaf180 TaxID=1736289 RepID=UPI0006F5C658|nr:hypothetical protein [Chryseobacterium sp. Leaf180]KQR95177.1 hypothetical protein ASG01_04815 [Chryseobacterium sp. Leaf180]